MNILAKALRGDDKRLSRFHTEANDLCDPVAYKNFHNALASWILMKARGDFKIQPWWVYEAIRTIEDNLRQTDRVLEVGSGYSSLWLAQRVQSVCSIEENKNWLNDVLIQAQKLGLKNLNINLGDSRSNFREKLSLEKWDVVIIDGSQERFEIFQDLLQSPELPRLIIYDDTDRVENRAALNVNRKSYQRKTYRGFKPQTVHVCETTIFKYTDVI